MALNAARLHAFDVLLVRDDIKGTMVQISWVIVQSNNHAC